MSKMTNYVAFNINIASQKDKVKQNLPSLSHIQKFLTSKFQPFYLHFFRGGEYLTLKAPKRGTREYFDIFIKKRFRGLSKKLNKLIKVDKRGDNWGFTNSIFLTYTFECDVLKSWELVKRFSGYFDKVKKRLERRGYKILLGLRVVEAQQSGRAHLHCLIVLNHFFTYRVDLSKGRGFVKKQSQFEEFVKIFDLGMGFIDIQPIYSHSQALNYLGKYILKGSQGVEDLLGVEEERLSESDIKRLLGLYYLLMFRLRQFSIFGVLRKLDKSINNNSDKGWVKIRGLLLGYWLGYLKGLGLGDFAGLGIISVRGSPERGVCLIF